MGKLPKRWKQIILIFSLILITLLLSILVGEVLFQKLYPLPPKIKYGVTFSPKFASQMGLDWQKTYLAMLDDLQVKYLRVPTYWDEIEKEQMQYDFSAVDFMLDEVKNRGVKVILILGARQPRWPECHIPAWAKELTVAGRQEKVLELVGRVVERYKHHTAIIAWQVENEPLFSSFGEGCDPPDAKFLKSEVELARQLNGKPIIVTDSGELGWWITPMSLSDIFGTTLYRKVYNSVLGYTTYPFLPYMYNLKSTILRWMFTPNNKKTIISELQAEPWAADNNLKDMTIEQQIEIFSVDEFKEYVNYAQQTGFDTAYLWGVEWWYWMAQNEHPEYLEYAKTLFK